jgi:hypothetical protein
MAHYDDAILSIQVRRYGRAAEYMLKELFEEKIRSMKPKQLQLMKGRIAKELEAQRNNLRQTQYSGRMNSTDRTEMARETYERTYMALDLDKYDDSVIEI